MIFKLGQTKTHSQKQVRILVVFYLLRTYQAEVSRF